MISVRGKKFSRKKEGVGRKREWGMGMGNGEWGREKIRERNDSMNQCVEASGACVRACSRC